jgi:superfamily II DNA or RNA helicase
MNDSGFSFPESEMDSQSERPAPRFCRGDAVIRAGKPEIIGSVSCDPDWDSGEWWYDITFGKARQSVAEYDLAPPPSTDEDVQDLAMRGEWGTHEALLRAVAVERICNQNQSTVYSFNAHRIALMPHQYRPLLKFLDSEDRRLLIADEVGLGKTIEAGLILTEIQARESLRRVLIVVPSRLRSKWQREMHEKFRLDFQIWSRQHIEEYVERVSRGSAFKDFLAIVSYQMLRREDLLDAFVGTGIDLDALIFDEAHHARNAATRTHKMMADLGDIAGSCLFLSATPLHLGSADLFNLLRLLRPSEFSDQAAFERSLERNSGIVAAQTAVRRRDHVRLMSAERDIRRAYRGYADPLIDGVLDYLQAAPESSEDWGKLDRLLDQAHVLSNVFSRTKKRDVIEHAPQRDGRWVQVTWTEEEDRCYEALAGLHEGQSREQLGLGQIQRARQAASSIPGALAFRQGGMGAEEDFGEFDEGDFLDDSAAEERAPSPMALAAPDLDTKYEALREILRGIWAEQPDAKVIIFTFFVSTSKYLEGRLLSEGVGVGRIAGDVPSNPMRPEDDVRAKVIETFKSDPSVKVLVSTEVGSEGLDFQFCSTLVNYDLPWNPMVVEQRIGRIDRYGQESDKLKIFSLVVENTIEGRILKRLYDRIGIFERTVGDLETILGDEVRELRKDFFSFSLSESELMEKTDRVARIIENRRREVVELAQKAEELVGHEDFIREEVHRVQRLGRYLTPAQIQSVVSAYLKRHHPDIHLRKPAPGIWRINLTNSLLRDVESASDPGSPYSVELRLRSRENDVFLTTEGNRAYEEHELVLLNATNPLVRAAAQSLEDAQKNPGSRVACLRLRAGDVDGDLANPGMYFALVVCFNISGTRSRRVLEAFVIHRESGEVTQGDSAERFAFQCLENGEEHPSSSSLPGLSQDEWRALMSSARRRKADRQRAEDLENRSRIERRRTRLKDEEERKVRSAEQRIRTLRDRGRSESVIHASMANLEKIRANFNQKRLELSQAEAVIVDFDLPPIACCAVEVSS